MVVVPTSVHVFAHDLTLCPVLQEHVVAEAQLPLPLDGLEHRALADQQPAEQHPPVFGADSRAVSQSMLC